MRSADTHTTSPGSDARPPAAPWGLTASARSPRPRAAAHKQLRKLTGRNKDSEERFRGHPASQQGHHTSQPSGGLPASTQETHQSAGSPVNPLRCQQPAFQRPPSQQSYQPTLHRAHQPTFQRSPVSRAHQPAFKIPSISEVTNQPTNLPEGLSASIAETHQLVGPTSQPLKGTTSRPSRGLINQAPEAHQSEGPQASSPERLTANFPGVHHSVGPPANHPDGLPAN